MGQLRALLRQGLPSTVLRDPQSRPRRCLPTPTCYTRPRLDSSPRRPLLRPLLGVLCGPRRSPGSDALAVSVGTCLPQDQLIPPRASQDAAQLSARPQRRHRTGMPPLRRSRPSPTARNPAVDTPLSQRWGHGAGLAAWLAMVAAAAAVSLDPDRALPDP